MRILKKRDPAAWLEMKKEARRELNRKGCLKYARTHRDAAAKRAAEWYEANRERALANGKRYRAARRAREAAAKQAGQIPLPLPSSAPAPATARESAV